MTSLSIYSSRFQQRATLLVALLFAAGLDLAAQRTLQGGQTALDGVRSGLVGYYPVITNICYIIAAILGIVGGVQVYSKMVSGDPGAGATGAKWGAGAVFLVAVPAIIDALFIPA